MRILTPDGVVFADVPDPSARSKIGAHWSAVGYFIDTGDASRLSNLESLSVAGYEFETDPDAIEDAARAGELEFEEIYEEPQ